MVTTLREQLVQAGRRPDDVKVFMGTAVVTGETQAVAREKYADYLRYASREAGLAHFAASTGVDFARHGLDEPIDYGNGNAIESATRAAAQHGWDPAASCSSCSSSAAAIPRSSATRNRSPTNCSRGSARPGSTASI